MSVRTSRCRLVAMSLDEHYEKAEELLANAMKATPGPMTDGLVGSAQVHATLALVDAVESLIAKVTEGLLDLSKQIRKKA